MGIQFDAALAGTIVTVLLALLGLAYGYGSLSNRVTTNAKDIDRNKTEQAEICYQIRCEFKSYQLDNKGDHTMIFNKLEEINKFIRENKG